MYQGWMRVARHESMNLGSAIRSNVMSQGLGLRPQVVSSEATSATNQKPSQEGVRRKRRRNAQMNCGIRSDVAPMAPAGMDISPLDSSSHPLEQIYLFA
jgi:hypothetical protein